MRNLENFYVKNVLGETHIYFRLKPIVFPENEFTYEGTEIHRKAGETVVETYNLTYRDILRLYEDGYHTIEREEFERVEAQVSQAFDDVEVVKK